MHIISSQHIIGSKCKSPLFSFSNFNLLDFGSACFEFAATVDML